MSAIFGVLSKASEKLEPGIINRGMKALAHWDPEISNIWLYDYVAFGHHLLPSTLESKLEALPRYEEKKKCCITADARLDYREELIQKLGIDLTIATIIPDSHLILEAYYKWGNDCVKYLFGDFAFGIWDSSKEELFCARDQIGCRPFYYFENSEYFLFATEMIGLFETSIVPLKIKSSFIADSITTILPDKDSTAYENIHRLQPAHYIIIKAGTNSEQKKYWDLQINEEFRDLPLSESIIMLKKLFSNAVQQRCRSISPIGIELSGGLDSSGIAAIASEYVKEQEIPLYALTQALTQSQKEKFFPYQDEIQYSNEVVKNCNLDGQFLITGVHSNGYLSELSRITKSTLSPINIGYAMFSELLYEKAEELNIRVLLSGFGGDEGISSQASGYFNELIVCRDWAATKDFIDANRNKSKIKTSYQTFKLLLRYMIPWLNEIKPFFRLDKNWRREKYPIFAIHSRIEKHHQTRKRYLRNNSKDLMFLHERQYKKIMDSNISIRLESSFIEAQSRKIEYRYPFWDVKLIEFYYSLPSEYKFRNGIGRYIYREAMKGIIPEKIRTRFVKSGNTIPNIQYRFQKDLDEYIEFIKNEKESSSYQYVDYEKILALIKLVMEKDPSKHKGMGIRAFFNAFSVLLLQKWQREGKIDIGIKC